MPGGDPIGVVAVAGDLPSARAMAELQHEYAILRELDVPGVPRALSLQRSADRIALLMDDPGERTLHAVLDGGAATLDQFVNLALELTTILGAVHQRGIVHKDIRPPNLIVDAALTRVHLVGFRLAQRLSHESLPVLHPNAIQGTLAYISPEQTGRMNRPVDYRADFYSLGATLYEMLTGAPPFSGEPIDVVHSHIARSPIPPIERTPALPEAVSEIVLKLLAKTPEGRYQTAAGLAADLGRCAALLASGERSFRFPLGRHDHAGLQVPQRVYGRTGEVEAVLRAFERVKEGAVELVLVKGGAGVGKSALVNEVYRSLARHELHFVSGKFDQLGQGPPYAAFADAFRELIRHILTRSDRSLAQWRAALVTRLGVNARVIADLVPELELVTGPLAPVAPLGPTEAKNRFGMAFQDFVRVATAGQPLVMFLDDLQWSDPSSLQMLELLMADVDLRHVLVIGAYRDNEVDEAHPLTLTLGALQRGGATLTTVELAPLALPEVTAIVCDTLTCDSSKALPLAALLFERTRGNPFFLGQLLAILGRDHVISFDPAASEWTWDERAIRRYAATDNVVDLIVRKIEELPPGTAQLLGLAACIGYRFDLRMLARLSGRAPAAVAPAIWSALQAGVLLPEDPDYRFLASHTTDAEPLIRAEELHVPLRFLHDRVQQAACSFIGEDERREAHVRLGRLLLAACAGEPEESALLDIVRHLNLGAELITDRDERTALARLNLAAGSKAQAATAHDTAARCFAAGAALLDGGGWEAEYPLAFELHVRRAECESMNGQPRVGDAVFDEALARARSRAEKARIYTTRVNLCFSRGRATEALDAAAAGLALFEDDILTSGEDIGLRVRRELGNISTALAGRTTEDLLAAPAITDPDVRAHLTLLVVIQPAVFGTRPALYPLLITRRVHLLLRHGQFEESAFSYAAYAILLASILNRHAEAYPFAELALDLAERYGGIQSLRVNFQLGMLSHHLPGPVRVGIARLDRARQLGLELGDFAFASYACSQKSVLQLGIGEDLQEIHEAVAGGLALMRRTKDAMTTDLLLISRQLTACLRGETDGPESLSDPTFDEVAFMARNTAVGLPVITCWYSVAKLHVAFLHRNYVDALKRARDAQQYMGVNAVYWMVDWALNLCLTLLALGREATGEARERYLAELAAPEARIAGWARNVPWNFQQKHLLVAAERASLEGREADALLLYDQAIDAAAAGEFMRDEALANELCADFHLRHGRRRLAGFYATAAYRAYMRWGATSKVRDVAARLLRDVLPDGAGSLATTAAPTGRIIDMGAVLGATQAIADDIELDSVLYQVMRIVVSSAGAQRGFLILDHAGALSVEASSTIDPDQVRVRLRMPLDSCDEMSTAIVHYVARTGEVIRLGDASAERRFGDDPYIVTRKPKAVLCLPLTRRGRRICILYLENNATVDAFSEGRLEFIRLLSSQIAIAVENALLYEQVQNSVQLVTSELVRSNLELAAAKARLEVELADRIAAEQARAALQDEHLRAQGARLVELSTPFIPITDHIMVMPLIGTLDPQRGQQVLETALKGASEQRAEVVILDLTGLKHADVHVVALLLDTVRALRLLGVRCILTGIGVDMARMMAENDVGFAGVTTCATLQVGVALALAGDPARPAAGVDLRRPPPRRT